MEASLPNTVPVEKTELQEGFGFEDYQPPDFWGLAVSMHPSFENVKLRDSQTSLGRSPKCTIRIAHPAVSGVHCWLYRDEDGVVSVKDVSSNGTYIKGEKLGKNCSLVISDGMEIVLMKADSEKISYVIYFTQRSLEEEENAKQGGPEAEFDIRETLGSGGFATVKLGIHRRSGRKYAIKCIEKAKAIQCAPHRSQAWMDEITILRGLDHPNIVKISALFQTQSTIYVVLELLRGGDLFDNFLPQVQKREGWPEAKCLYIIRQIVKALAYLHGRNIVHRDLKLENILLAEGGDWPTIKLTDFGLARIVDESNACITKVGTEMYCAPEVAHQGEGTAYDKQVDVWALGIVSHILLVGVQPYIPKQRFSQEQFDRLNYRQPFWKRVSSEALDLVKKMLRVDPQDRITVAEIPHQDWMCSNLDRWPDSAMSMTDSPLIDDGADEKESVPQKQAEPEQQAQPAKVDAAHFVDPMQKFLTGAAQPMGVEEMTSFMQQYLNNPHFFPHPSAEQARNLFAHAQRTARQLIRAVAAKDDEFKEHADNGSWSHLPIERQVSKLRDFFSAAALGAYQMSVAAAAPLVQQEPVPFSNGALTHFPAGAHFVPVPIPVPVSPELAQELGMSNLFDSLASSAAQLLNQISGADTDSSSSDSPEQSRNKRRHGDLDVKEEPSAAVDPRERARKRLRPQQKRK